MTCFFRSISYFLVKPYRKAVSFTSFKLDKVLIKRTQEPLRPSFIIFIITFIFISIHKESIRLLTAFRRILELSHFFRNRKEIQVRMITGRFDDLTVIIKFSIVFAFRKKQKYDSFKHCLTFLRPEIFLFTVTFG